jgi:phosphoenolpyruvate synthase/pyruvate phosphate dikinase
MVEAQVAFIMHTKGVEGEDAVMIEVCEGQGEVLASANEKGTPYRLVYDKKKKLCSVTAWGSYSHGLFRGETELVRKRVSGLDEKFLLELGNTLGQIGMEIEAAYGSAQDIEGCVEAGGQIYIVQTRA